MTEINMDLTNDTFIYTEEWQGQETVFIAKDLSVKHKPDGMKINLTALVTYAAIFCVVVFIMYQTIKFFLDKAL